MLRKFDNAVDAANFVAEGIAADFPDATAEIVQVIRNTPRRVTCKVDNVRAALHSACRTFPKASVEYHPENPYGFVAEIRCHGERGASTTFERHRTERARVLVLLTRLGDREVLIGSHIAPGANRR